jgi:hypothetical protein
MLRAFFKQVSSNFRASQAAGRVYSGNSFPLWSSGDATCWRFQWAAYYLKEVYDYDLPLTPYGNNVVDFLQVQPEEQLAA